MNQAAIAHPDRERLADFLAGKLNEAESTVIEEHVAGCDTCREVFDSLPDDTLIGLLRPETDASTAVGNARPTSSGPVPASEVPPVLTGHPRYRIVELLGAGGMGAVYKAVHVLMKRTVALKVISPKLIDRPEMVERFVREVQTAARLDHRNIVKAHDAEQADSVHFLVMEFVEGISLAEKVKRTGPLPAPLACDYVWQAANGLQHAHQLGMVHRDIKPHNLMLTIDGVVKVLDFGLAHFVSEAGTECSPTFAGEVGSLTEVGTRIGTPDFMAPEQADDAHRADIRADIYSLGCTLYYLLAGHPPFTGGGRVETLAAQARSEAKPLHLLRSEVPPELSAVVARMLAKDPAARYQTPAEVMQALAPFLHAARRPRTHRRRWLAVAALLFFGAAVPIAWVAFTRFDTDPNEGGLPNPDSPPIPFIRVESAAKWQAAEADRLGVPVETRNSNGITLRFIPAGKFMMGSPETEPQRNRDELQHEVTITKPFYMGAHEVTQAQYERVMRSNPAAVTAARGGGPDHPVEMVSWDAAVAFCRKLSEVPAERALGRVYRLPTEAEWEYACRAGSTSAYHFGPSKERLAGYDWHHRFSEGRTNSVGRLLPNAFGLFDLHGNVVEWCSDWYAEDYYQQSPANDPTGPSDVKLKVRVARGGAWCYSEMSGRCAARQPGLPINRSDGHGFRVVMVESPAK